MKTTPDLSTSFHPQPKVFRAKKSPKRLGVGSRTTEWDLARRELKKIFEAHEITSCELRLPDCWKKTGLTFAHFAKRRDLSPEDLKSVALLCIKCHEHIERLPAKQMEKVVKDIIKKRGW